MEATPANVVLHFWHYDPDYSHRPGQPRALRFDGPNSFSTLVMRYAGDIPPGALRTELCRAGTVSESDGGLLTVQQRYFHSTYFDEDFVRRIAFSLENLATTVVHNARLHREANFDERMNVRFGRFERCAWTEHLGDEATEAFKVWARQEGSRFIERVDSWLGEHELPRERWNEPPKSVGVGVYYFEEDR
jgi:hypothetical protein